MVENTDEVFVETQSGKVAGGGFVWFGESLQTLFSGILEKIWRQKIYGRDAMVVAFEEKRLQIERIERKIVKGRSTQNGLIKRLLST